VPRRQNGRGPATVSRRAAAAALIGLPLTAGEAERVPVDEDALNDFAASYNAYVLALRSGRIDLDQWRRVRRAWAKMTGLR
jgi:hypothetical protein